MKQDFKIQGLSKLGEFLQQFLQNSEEEYSLEEAELFALMKKSEVENPWFTIENQRFCFKNWADILKKKILKIGFLNIRFLIFQKSRSYFGRKYSFGRLS
jgi:hypothetical protein